jgi:ABC-type antimicrobial peptide transport system permease subunit
VTLRASLRAAVEEMASNRARSALAMLSVVVGVWSVTVVVAAGDMGRQALLQNVEETLGLPATVSISVSEPPPGLQFADVRTRLATVMQRYGAPQSSSLEVTTARVQFQAMASTVTLNGVDTAFAAIHLLPVTAGRWLDEHDQQLSAPDVVLNTDAASRLGLTGGTGQLMELGTLQPVRGRVIGVVATPSQDGPAVFMPAGLLERYGAPVGVKASFSYLVRVPPQQVGQFIAVAQVELATWDLSAQSNVQRVDQVGDLSAGLLAIQVVLALIAGLALLTGAIGILNLALVSVRERVFEFGIRRAFGATKASIFTIVLAEVAFTTTVAGVVGVLLAAATVLALPGLLAGLAGGGEVNAPFPLDAALLGLLLASVIGLAVGIIPAHRATARTVIDALRR